MSILVRCSDDFRDWLCVWGYAHGAYTTAQALDALREFVVNETARAEYVALGKVVKFAKSLKGKLLKKSVYTK
jgi:uncharacterized transporter YbjL